MSIDYATPPIAIHPKHPATTTPFDKSDQRGEPALAPEFTFDVAIVGLGYVGLPTALALHAAGSQVLGVDTSVSRMATIHSGQADLLESDRGRLEDALASDNFETTSRVARLKEAAAVIICVPTPVDEYQTPDISILRAACTTAVDAAVPGQLIVLTSTTYAGCTHDLLVRPLHQRGFTVGEDILVAFSPERIDPGNESYAHEDVPRVVGGANERSGGAAAALLGRYARHVHRVNSLEAAEMTKLLENTFRAVNIALANEFAEACNTLGLPVTEVIDAAATKPYGFMPFYPGPGVGGHCIPCDPHYLLWQMRKEHITLPIIEMAMSEIAGRPRRVVERIREVLASTGKAVKDSRILIAGITYKPDVADLRESPALEIINLLHAAGCAVGYIDPYVSSFTTSDGIELIGTIDPTSFEADLVLLHTDHTTTDRAWMSQARTLIDTTYRRSDLAQRITL